MKRIFLTVACAAFSSIAAAHHLYDPSTVQAYDDAHAAGSRVLQDWLTDNSADWDDIMRKCKNRVASSDLIMQYKCYAYSRVLSDVVMKTIAERHEIEFDSRKHLLLWVFVANSVDGELKHLWKRQ